MLMRGRDRKPGTAVHVPAKQLVRRPLEVIGTLPDGCDATDVVVTRRQLATRLTNLGVGHVHGHNQGGVADTNDRGDRSLGGEERRFTTVKKAGT